MHHYVYLLLGSDGRYYYGSRTCRCHPKEDEYWGSFTDRSFLPKRKRILSIWEFREEALAEEIRIHNLKEVGTSPRYANRAKQTSVGFDRTGVPCTEEHKKKLSNIMNEPQMNNRLKERLKAVPHTEEWNQRIKESLSKPGVKEKIGQFHKGRKKSEATKQRMKENHPMKKREVIKKHKEIMNTPEVREKIAKANKGKRRITDGRLRRWLKDGESLKDGWRFGWDLSH